MKIKVLSLVLFSMFVLGLSSVPSTVNAASATPVVEQVLDLNQDQTPAPLAQIQVCRAESGPVNEGNTCCCPTSNGGMCCGDGACGFGGTPRGCEFQCR